MRFEEPTKWEIFLDGFHNFWNCLDCYNDGDTWGYDEFWEGLNLGWYMEYIYPYDDDFNPTTSHVRQLRLDAKPYVHTIYVSEEAYDKLPEPPPQYFCRQARDYNGNLYDYMICNPDDIPNLPQQ